MDPNLLSGTSSYVGQPMVIIIHGNSGNDTQARRKIGIKYQKIRFVTALDLINIP